MKVSKWYLGLSDEGKTLFWLVLVDIVVFLILLPFSLLSYLGLALGWLLGSAVVLICYLTMVKGSSVIMNMAGRENGRNKGMAWTFAFSIGRLLLMVGALVFSAFMTFKVEGNFVNFFTTAAAYFPLIVVSIVFTLIHHRKKKAPEAKIEAKTELEVGEEPLDE